jgi:uncharacterized protein YggE
MNSAFFSWKKYMSYILMATLAIFVWQWVTNPMVIVVTGVGSISAPAESAVLTFSLVSSASNADEALSNVKNNAEKLKNTLKEIGIPESEIYESQIAVTPSESSFQGSVSMGLKTDKITMLDRVISILYSGGAVVVSQPVLTAKNVEDMDKKAYDMAIKDAKKKASEIALSNLKIFKKIVLIQESQAQGSSTVTTKADEATQITDNISPDTGLLKINKVVSVSYKMW